MASMEISGKPLSVSRQMNSKHASRIPVLISKTKSSSTDPTTTVSTTHSIISTFSTNTLITVNSIPKKSVTVTLLPLPSTRKSSLTSDKKLSGILKNASSTSRKNALPQNIPGSNKFEGKTTQRRVVCSVPDLIRNVPAKQIDRLNKETFKAVEKWLPFVKTIQNNANLEHEITSNFNKRDSFSDDTTSSVTSYSSPCCELSNNSEDARWSSATSGYESDETICNMKLLDKSRKLLIPTQISRNKLNQPVTTPWLISKELDLQNVEILTEEEISTLNARLERIFEIYKKMERNRSIKNASNPKGTSYQGNKYIHVKAKVQSNAPRFMSRQTAFHKNIDDVTGNKPERIYSFKLGDKIMQQCQAKLKTPKKESINCLKSLKNCVSGSEKKVKTNLFQQNQHWNYSNRIQTGFQAGNFTTSTTSGSCHAAKNLQNIGATKKTKTYPDRKLEITKNTGSLKSKNVHSLVSPVKSITKSNLGAPSVPRSPVTLTSEMPINRMANFKCPRVKQRYSVSSIDVKLSNHAICTSPVIRKREDSRETSADIQNLRGTKSVLLNMRLPKKLSKAEVEQGRRLSSGSLGGHGFMGISTFGEKQREVIRNEMANYRDSKLGLLNFNRDLEKLTGIPFSEIRPQRTSYPTSFHSSSMQSIRRSKEIHTRNNLDGKYRKSIFQGCISRGKGTSNKPDMLQRATKISETTPTYVTPSR